MSMKEFYVKRTCAHKINCDFAMSDCFIYLYAQKNRMNCNLYGDTYIEFTNNNIADSELIKKIQEICENKCLHKKSYQHAL